MKGQVRSVGMVESTKRNVNVFEVSMTPGELCERYTPDWRLMACSVGMDNLWSDGQRLDDAK